MDSSQKRKETILITIVLAVDLLLLAVLGTLVWSHFVASKLNTTTTEGVSTSTSESSSNTSKTTIESTGANVTYTNKEFSFQYPATGWTVKEVSYGDDMPPTTTLTSSDYTQTGMGVDSGAIISVNITDKETTIDEEFAKLQEQRTTFGIEDLQKTTFQGQSTITYHSGYEGMRYHTIYLNDGKIYDVVYMYADDADTRDTYMDVYDMVTLSFIFI